MNILIIGNGFDVAHGLPTKYKDFLDYCKNYSTEDPISADEEVVAEFTGIIEINVWLKYFQHLVAQNAIGEWWIDLEREIAHTVMVFDSPKFSYTERGPVFIVDKNKKASSEFAFFFDSPGYTSRNQKVYPLNAALFRGKQFKTKSSFIEWLYGELRAFTRAFEIYCVWHVNELRPVNPAVLGHRTVLAQLQADIEDASSDKIEKMVSVQKGKNSFDSVKEFHQQQDELIERKKSLIQSLLANSKAMLATCRFDCILSFNYTNTYERLYYPKTTTEHYLIPQYCCIHGEAQSYPDKTNMVLGIDDPLDNDMAHQNFEWVKFKKYFQRILLKTGSDYKDWLKGDEEKHVHIIGHSMDKTDHDVLREFLTDKNCRTTIYYWNEDDHNRKIEQAIAIVGRDELIEKVHGSDWTIQFVNQYGEEGLFDEKARPPVHQ